MKNTSWNVLCAEYACPTPIRHNKVTYDEKCAEICNNCGYALSLIVEYSELSCYNCGLTQHLVGTAFDDAQFYYQVGQKRKSGVFDPKQHFSYWITHILAREPEYELGNDPRSLMSTIIDTLKRKRYVISQTNIEIIRDTLKETGKTNLNKNASLILSKITGVSPPNLHKSF